MKKMHTVFIAGIALIASLVLLGGCGDDKSRQDMPAGFGEINPRYSEDVKVFEQALATDPDNVDLLIQLGNKYYDWGEDEARTAGQMAQPVPKWLKAIEYYKRALAVDPSNADVRTDMANLLGWVGSYDEAEREYRTAININPKHPQSRINLILLIGGRMGHYADAIKEYDALLKASPEQENNTALRQEVEGYRVLMEEAKK